MPTYVYKAKDKLGGLISGTADGENEAAVVEDLDKIGYSVISLAPKKKSTFLSFSLKEILEHHRPIPRQDVIIFTRQLATLLRTGMGLSPSLGTISEQTVNEKFKAVLNDISQSVQGGSSFSQALSKHSQVFPELFISMVNVGETGGMLDKVLDRLAGLGAQEMETAARIKSALVYPIVLVLAAFLIVNFLMIGVLPKFVMVFQASQAKLPLPTQIVLGLSWIMRKLWMPILAAAGLCAFWFRRYAQTPSGKYKLHLFSLKVPVFGELYSKIQISRFCRTLSVLTSSGIPLLQALTVVEKTITNVAIQRALQSIRRSISEGQSLVEPFKASGFFSPMVVQMIATAEKSGRLDQILEEIAGFYDPEIEYTIRNLTSILEPFMLLIMGAMVGFIALSVLLPIFNLIKVFRG